MTDSYLNITYPSSNKMYSRPFSEYLKDQRSDSENNVADFQEKLFAFGKDLLGDVWGRCLNINLAWQERSFTTPFWNEDRVISAADSKEFIEYRSTFSPEGRDALDAVIDEIKLKKTFSDKPEDEYGSAKVNPTRGEYDLPALRRNFETVWKEKPLLDPRIAFAEELFVSIADSSPDSAVMFDNFIDKDNGYKNLSASLHWMAEPKNADNIAKMFLYSRLAQHFGETNPDVYEFAGEIHKALKTGIDSFDTAGEKSVVMNLKSNPYGYFEKVMKRDDAPMTKMEMFKEGLRSMFLTPRKEAEIYVMNYQDLRRSVDSMVADHRRLLDGTWAREKIDEIGNNIISSNLKLSIN